MNTETNDLEEARSRLRGVAAKLVERFGTEEAASMFLVLTTSLLALDRDAAALGAFLRDLADEVESLERPIEPFSLN